MAPPERPDDLRAWLATGPSLREMRERYPDEWRTVQRELSEVAAEGDVEALARYAASIARTPQVPRAGRRGRDAREALGRAEVRRHLAAAALRQTGVAAATGVTEGPLRFGLVNGWVAQRLLFRKGLERKPVRLRPFRLLWPLLRQRRYLMPLVEPQGIFCFYSAAFVRELAALIGARPALEIAAGDGTLSRFLRDAGVAITATDDGSWTQISFPADVLREDAVAALRRHAPRAVVCSWPPAANRFERAVFATASVELYVVVLGAHEFASGDWAAYRAQDAFALRERPDLAALVLPPELEARVLVFERLR